MLIWGLAILTVLLWSGILVVYFRIPLKRWFDNRFGPDQPTPKPPRLQRPRRYD